jgi:hypothetical protein
MSIMDNGAARPATAAEVAQLRQQLTTLNAQANRGDAGALQELRAFLAVHPYVEQTLGDLAARVERAWLGQLAAGDALQEVCYERQLQQLKAELAGPTPTGVERLVVDQAGSAYLAERAAALACVKAGGNATGAQLRQVESAQRRLFAALRLLTQVRVLTAQQLPPAPRLFEPERHRA